MLNTNIDQQPFRTQGNCVGPPPYRRTPPFRDKSGGVLDFPTFLKQNLENVEKRMDPMRSAFYPDRYVMPVPLSELNIPITPIPGKLEKTVVQIATGHPGDVGLSGSPCGLRTPAIRHDGAETDGITLNFSVPQFPAKLYNNMSIMVVWSLDGTTTEPNPQVTWRANQLFLDANDKGWGGARNNLVQNIQSVDTDPDSLLRVFNGATVHAFDSDRAKHGDIHTTLIPGPRLLGDGFAGQVAESRNVPDPVTAEDLQLSRHLLRPGNKMLAEIHPEKNWGETTGILIHGVDIVVGNDKDVPQIKLPQTEKTYQEALDEQVFNPEREGFDNFEVRPNYKALDHVAGSPDNEACQGGESGGPYSPFPLVDYS
jgi:hypothetical protein